MQQVALSVLKVIIVQAATELHVQQVLGQLPQGALQHLVVLRQVFLRVNIVQEELATIARAVVKHVRV